MSSAYRHRQSCRVSRFQGLLAVCWTSLCTFIILKRAGVLSQEHIKLLWTYFQPLAPPLLMLGLWAQVLAHFDQQQISFEACFPEKERKQLPTSNDIANIARVYVCIAIGALAWCMQLCTTGSAITPLLVPPVLYFSMLVLLLLPVNVMKRKSRLLFVQTVGKVLAPLQPVGWADFLLADMLTSLAKSSSDLSRSVCLMLHGPLVHPSHPSSAAAAAACGPLTAVSLAALVLPYFVRMVQCISVWRAGGPRSQLFNAFKYASSLPALILTAIGHEYHVHKKLFPLKSLWICVMMINSGYSYYWDVEQDWDMPWIMTYGGTRLGPICLPALKGSHMYDSGWYAWLLASNLVLRFTWAHRLFGDLESHNEVLMAVALLEVVRRWQWVFVRVETELRKLGVHESNSIDEDVLNGHSKGHRTSYSDSHATNDAVVIPLLRSRPAEI